MRTPGLCPSCGAPRPAIDAIGAAVLEITSELALEPVLRKIVDAARELVGARYAALGTPDDHGGFERFLTSGMPPELWEAIGPLPRTHGMLGAMLTEASSYRTHDVSADERFEGWPAHHPHMRSFLGVPITSQGRVVGAFYLTDKLGGGQFTPQDQHLVETLARHAAIAIQNAEAYERSRELSVVQERNRIARELHDAVVQKLFGASLAATSAAMVLDRDPGSARALVGDCTSMLDEALEELRGLVFELRPWALDTDGLAGTLRKHAAVLSRVYGVVVDVQSVGLRSLTDSVEQQILRVAQEAMSNAVRHAGAMRVVVRLSTRASTAELTVEDDGTGFDPTGPDGESASLGLATMRERAEALGGRVEIRSRPGAGTIVALEVPA